LVKAESLTDDGTWCLNVVLVFNVVESTNVTDDRRHTGRPRCREMCKYRQNRLR